MPNLSFCHRCDSLPTKLLIMCCLRRRPPSSVVVDDDEVRRLEGIWWQNGNIFFKCRDGVNSKVPAHFTHNTRKEEITTLSTYVALVRISAVGIAAVGTTVAFHRFTRGRIVESVVALIPPFIGCMTAYSHFPPCEFIRLYSCVPVTDRRGPLIRFDPSGMSHIYSFPPGSWSCIHFQQNSCIELTLAH